VLVGLLLLIYLIFFEEINRFIWDFAQTSFGESFLANLLATIVGVALGIPIAFWINRRVETATEKEKKTKILSSLRDELTRNHDLLIEWRKNEDSKWELTTLGIRMGYEIWNAFSDRGELEWIKDPALLGDLANTYGEIKRIKYLSDKYLSFNSMPASTAQFILSDLTLTIQRGRIRIQNVMTLIETYHKIEKLKRQDQD